MALQKTAIGPGSIFNRQRGSKLNRRQQYILGTCLDTLQSIAQGLSQMSDFLIYEQREHVVTLTMNEPERRNPLTGNSAVPDFMTAIDRINPDHSVRAVILTGAGTAFSSGGDVNDMLRHSSGQMSGVEIRQEYRLGIQRLPLALFNLEVPVI